jgi:hypothetical protein
VIPDRRHFVVTMGAAPAIERAETIELKPGDLYLQLRRALRRYPRRHRPMLFDGRPPLRAAAAPRPNKDPRLQPQSRAPPPALLDASWLFLRGVPLDRIFCARAGSSVEEGPPIPDGLHVVDGRPLDPPASSSDSVAILPLSAGAWRHRTHLSPPREAAAEFDIFLFAFAKDPPGIRRVSGICAKAIVVSPPYYREPRGRPWPS